MILSLLSRSGRGDAPLVLPHPSSHGIAHGDAPLVQGPCDLDQWAVRRVLQVLSVRRGVCSKAMAMVCSQGHGVSLLRDPFPLPRPWPWIARSMAYGGMDTWRVPMACPPKRVPPWV
jgi:hypothetical protein